MPAQDNKATVRRIVEDIWNAGNLTMVDEIYTANFVGHWPHKEIRGIDDVKKQVNNVCLASLNIHFTIEDRIAEGDRVLVRFTQRCTRKDEPNGIAPVRRHENRTGISVIRFEGGKIVEQWVKFDALPT